MGYVCESVSVLQIICSFVSFFSDSTYKWYHTLFVFVWLTTFNMILSRSTRVLLKTALFHSFYFCVIFHFIYLCVCVHVLHTVICTAVIYVKKCPAYVFPWIFIVSGVTFRSLIHFEFIFVYGVRRYSNFILLQCSCPVLPVHLLKRLSCLPCVSLPSLLCINWQ